jgi:serine/threonine protein kinase
MTTLVGQQLGKYRIEARLGRGGMAEVYRAYQPGLQRAVAIKVLHPHLADDAEFVARFEREARAVGQLRHPHIVQVYDFETVGDVCFLVMEYLEGETLKDRMARLTGSDQRLPLDEVVTLVEKIGSALDYAHGQGIIHRDVKPANIMYTGKGEPVLTDFGVARLLDGVRFTQSGTATGTPAYMSPEQGVGDEAGTSSDLYSLGVIVYELLTSKTPHDAETPLGIIMKRVTEPLPPPRSIAPELPEGVDHVLERALAREPADRYPTALDFARELRAALEGQPLPDRSIVPGGPAATHPPLRAWLAGAALGLIILVTGFALAQRMDNTPLDQSAIKPAAVSTPVVHSMAAPARADDVALADDFSDPESGWPTFGPPDSRAYADGQYELRITTPSIAVAALMDEGPRFHTFHASVDAVLVDGQPESGYGLVFHYQDPLNYYVFGINGLGQVSLWLLQDGQWHELRNLPNRQQWTVDANVKKSGQVNDLDLYVAESKITAVVNGVNVIEVEDGTFDFGQVGFYVATSTSAKDPLADVKFDNLKIDPVVGAMTK